MTEAWHAFLALAAAELGETSRPSVVTQDDIDRERDRQQKILQTARKGD